MASIVDDIGIAAKWIATALTSSGYAADFTLASLREIDRFLNDHSLSGKAHAKGLLSKDLGARIFALGAYTGEVIRLAAGGQWRGDDGDPKAEINVMLELPDGVMIWPVQRVMKRFKDGADDSLEYFGRAIVDRPQSEKTTFL